MEPITETARVLYVDDDPAFTEMASKILEQESNRLEVRTATDAESGLEIIESEPVDCVVSDYSMPGTDGLEFLRTVRKKHEELPFLLLTGKGSEEIASEAISSGVTDYLQKQRGTGHYSLLANRIANAVEQYWASQELDRRKLELEQKTERLDEFAGIVSHDLQSPLMVADSRLSLARKSCECGDSIEHIEAADTALDRMGEIIDATLTLAREGQIVDETERVDLAELADRCFRNVAPQETELELVIEELPLRADPDRLQHVLENLFANAVDHGGDTVTIRIGETEGNGFYIADDGPGIPEGEHDKIFEPGYSMSEAGTGFGLAIVEEIVEAHGWGVEVAESEEGGARFEITDVETV